MALRLLTGLHMITCYVRYVLDPSRIAEFERYASAWLRIIPRLGGRHHGYYLPHEGANNIALCLFSFESLSQYERYGGSRIAPGLCAAGIYR